jgi:hypothetical protein
VTVQQIPSPLHLFFTFCAVFMRISRIIITGLVVTIVLRRCHHTWQGPIAKGIVGLADMTPGVDPNAPGPIKQMHEAVDSAVETLSSMDQSGPNPDPTL